MSEAQEAKKGVVAEIAQKLEKAQGVVLLDYRGLTVGEVTALRKKLREAGVEYRVLKNTLVKLAADQVGIEGLEAYLHGPTAVAFGYDDPVMPAKILADFVKAAKKTEIKSGLVGKDVISAAGVADLANLPSKEVLVAKLLGTMNAPATRLASVLNGPMRALAIALGAIAEQKQSA